MEAEDFLRDSRVYVWKETFAVLKAKRPLPDAFAVVRDRNETTVVIDQSRVKDGDAVETERGWKILTFDAVLPFELVGFLARVSRALADEGISIFTISAYSTDHILVKEKDLPRAVKKLESLGCSVER